MHDEQWKNKVRDPWEKKTCPARGAERQKIKVQGRGRLDGKPGISCCRSGQGKRQLTGRMGGGKGRFKPPAVSKKS